MLARWLLVGFALSACSSNVTQAPGTASGAATGSGGATSSSSQGGASTSSTTSTAAQGGASTSSTATGQGGASTTGQGGSTTGVGGAGGGPSAICKELNKITLTGAKLVVKGGVWKPGQQAMVESTLESADGFNNYPGVLVTHNSPHVTPKSGKNSFFALLAKMPMAIGVPFTANASAPPGTKVTFELKVKQINEDCPGAATAKLEAVIQ